MAETNAFDIAVVGAGVVGCAVARRFARLGRRVVLLEAGLDILSGASKANSAILHTGFDAPPDSLELRCMQEGYAEYLELRQGSDLPLVETGAMVVAWSPEDLLRLDAIHDTAIDNGVPDVERLDRAAVLAREPALAAGAMGALLVPREHVIDPWSPFLAYVTEAQRLGAVLRFGFRVTSGDFDGETWQLRSSAGDRVAARTVVNCAGLFGDTLELDLLGDASFTIRPRKGQFVVFDKAAAALLRTIILPVPNERTKGVVLTRTAFGNLLVGPTAEEQEDRTRPFVTREALSGLIDRAVEMVPALADMPATATYAGLRPATEDKHYRIRHEPVRHWLTLGGIRSTGMTAALGLARHAERLLEGTDSGILGAGPLAPRMPRLAETEPRDWQRPGYGEIVCHCELVTRREIEAALGSEVPPRDFGGLRRRTRCGMGRCQGFYCHGHLAALTKGHFDVPLALEAAP